MNWYKFLSLIGIIFIITGLVFQIVSSSTSPKVSSLSFLEKLNYSLKSNKISISTDPICLLHLNFCRIEINSQNNKVLALINLQSDPFYQIASLQQILKIATMKNKHIEFIDLSDNRPYATLKNN